MLPRFVKVHHGSGSCSAIDRQALWELMQAQQSIFSHNNCNLCIFDVMPCNWKSITFWIIITDLCRVAEVYTDIGELCCHILSVYLKHECNVGSFFIVNNLHSAAYQLWLFPFLIMNCCKFVYFQIKIMVFKIWPGSPKATVPILLMI